GAALRDITVIRPHVAEGKTPEVFHIDLASIVLKNDAETNILLEPFDQVHVGQSRRSYFSDCLPPWLLTAIRYPLSAIRHPPKTKSG
ncbi:MAG: hypothetical protein ACREDL_25630, partial [Bradyrhizobium sp.]